jgi:stalled ribosome alternative rescue factor ArfA
MVLLLRQGQPLWPQRGFRSREKERREKGSFIRNAKHAKGT